MDTQDPDPADSDTWTVWWYACGQALLDVAAVVWTGRRVYVVHPVTSARWIACCGGWRPGWRRRRARRAHWDAQPGWRPLPGGHDRDAVVQAVRRVPRNP